MKKTALVLSLFVLFISSAFSFAQGPGIWRKPHRSQGYCPLCGRWENGEYADQSVPKTLPRPKSQEWISKLREVLALEKLSEAQYTADSEKFRIYMPYAMIIPQEQNHIDWIGRLFAAYGLRTGDIKVPKVKKSAGVTEAFQRAEEQEFELVGRYKWLIEHAEDDETREVLNMILAQTRMHYVMFGHMLTMDPLMGGYSGWWR